MEPNKEGAVMFTDFTLEGQWFAAMDGSTDMHNFTFNEAVSLVVNCDNQIEIDYYWANLSAFPEAEQCGWVKDKYGVSWQIVPANLNKVLSENPEKLIPEMLKMKKIIIADLERAIGRLICDVPKLHIVSTQEHWSCLSNIQRAFVGQNFSQEL